MTEPHQIGFKELYELVTSLDRKLDEYMKHQEPRIAVLEHRMNEAESDLEQARSLKNSERGLRWGLGGAIVAAVGSWAPDLIQLISK